jgi:DNA polymerase-3 subunit delta'
MSMNQYLENIYGHKNSREVISKIIDSSQIPHALLLAGKEGVGKDHFAIQTAKAINSKFILEKDKQHVLNGITNLNEPYLKFIFALPRGKNETDESGPYEKLSNEELAEAKTEINKKAQNPYHKIQLSKSSSIKVSSIRDINKFLSLQFEQSYYRFILISNAHLMNETSQNALLNNLEEPPQKVIFFLTTPYPELLRETVRSRCWSLFFSPLGNDDLTNILVEYFKIELNLAKEVSAFSDGSVSNAIQLIEHDFLSLKERTIRFLRYSLGKKFNLAYQEILPLISEKDSSTLRLFIQMIITWLNDLQRYKVSNSNLFYITHQDTLGKFNTKYPKSDINKVVIKLDQLSSLIQNNININLLSSNLIFTISSLTK